MRLPCFGVVRVRRLLLRLNGPLTNRIALRPQHPDQAFWQMHSD
jgi:hypothetical protein